MADPANHQTARRKKHTSRGKRRTTHNNNHSPTRKKSKSSQFDLFAEDLISSKEEVSRTPLESPAENESAIENPVAAEQSPKRDEAVAHQPIVPPASEPVKEPHPAGQSADEPLSERLREPSGDEYEEASHQDLARFSTPANEMEPRRLLRSQRQRAARLRKFLFIGGGALLLLLLIGLVVTLLTRTRVRVNVKGATKPAEPTAVSGERPIPGDAGAPDAPVQTETADRATDSTTTAPSSKSDATAEFQPAADADIQTATENAQTVDAVAEISPPATALNEEPSPPASEESVETTPASAVLSPPSAPTEDPDKKPLVSSQADPANEAISVAELSMAEPASSIQDATGTALADRKQAVPSAAAISEETRAVDFSSPWTNSLGMKLVPVKNTLFSIWETRVKDFEAFCEATGRERERAPFEESDDHPVSRMSWYDAQEFCVWLTQKERAEGIIGSNQRYRLPEDLEWSEAVGLEGEKGDTPESRDTGIFKTFPWGSEWPPPEGSVNIADRSASSRLRSTLDNYSDDYVRTAPVGSFNPNPLGIYDLSGNLWEWCQDAYGGKGRLRNWRVMRGGAWSTYRRKELLSSYRSVIKPDSRELVYGFRCVLVEEE